MTRNDDLVGARTSGEPGEPSEPPAPDDDRGPVAGGRALRPLVALAPESRRLAAIASLGAGAVHATAAGAHSDHRAAVVAFVVVAVAQIAWGALAILQPGRAVGLAGAAVNAAAFGGWLLAKTSGIGFVTGLDAPEGAQFADTLAAGLALVAVVGAVADVVRPRSVAPRHRPALMAVAAVATTVLVATGMVATGGHDHGEASAHEHADVAAPPRPYDATLPVDLGGIPGVTAGQQAEAEALVTETLEKLPQFADVAVAEARGYRSIGDALSGWEHLIRWDLIDDGVLLDPDRPESLVYAVDPTTQRRTLVAAMFMAASDATLDEVPDIGGALIQWHIHDDLCYRGQPGDWKLAAYALPPAPCPAGTERRTVNPMMHVWITPHECGPFASLEGVGAGQIAAGEERACDHAHGAPG